MPRIIKLKSCWKDRRGRHPYDRAQEFAAVHNQKFIDVRTDMCEIDTIAPIMASLHGCKEKTVVFFDNFTGCNVREVSEYIEKYLSTFELPSCITFMAT